MLRTDRTMIVGVLFLLPVMLALIGVGAFLHVVRAAAAQKDATAALGEQQIVEDELIKAIEDLERQIEKIRKRLAELEEAETREAELARLREELARLEKERSALLRRLEELEDRLGAKGEDCEELRRQAAEARRKLAELAREIALLEKRIEQMEPGPGPDGTPPDEGQSRADLEADIARIEEDVAAQEARNDDGQKELDRLNGELDRLRQRPDESAIQVDEVRGTDDWQVPPNPLYVECDGRGVVLQPERRRLPPRPTQSDRAHFARVARERGYVLFLIRPDGYDSFWQYRPLVMENRVVYGYEPISQHKPVIYPERR